MFKPISELQKDGAGWYQVEGSASDRHGNFMRFGWRVYAGNPKAAAVVALLEMGRLMTKAEPVGLHGQGLQYVAGMEPVVTPCPAPWTYCTDAEGWSDEAQEQE